MPAFRPQTAIESAPRTGRAVKRQLAGHQMAPHGLYDAHGAEDSDRHRQVEARALFADVGRGEIDGHRLVGVSEAGVEERGLDSLPALAHGDVGHTDHAGVLCRTAGIHVDFDVDQVRVNAIHRSRLRFEQSHREMSVYTVG